MCAAAACYSSAATDIPSRHPRTVQPVSLEVPNLTSTAARTALAREFVVYTAAPSSLALSLSSSGIALRSSSSVLPKRTCLRRLVCERHAGRADL